MSLSESVARLEAAKSDGPVPALPKFFWFDGADAETEAFHACVAKHGAKNVRTEYHLGLSPEGRWELWRKVVDKHSGKAVGEFDVSHPCPPDCPEAQEAAA